MTQKPTYEELEQKVKVLERENVSFRKEKEEIEFCSRLLEAVDQAVIAVDLDLRVTYYNHSAEKLYRWRESEIIGRSINEIASTKEMVKNANRILSKAKKGEKWSGEFSVKRKDGTVFLAMLTALPIQNDRGELIGLITMSTDITEQRRAEESLGGPEAGIRGISRVAPIGIGIVSDRTIQDVNNWFCYITGYSRDELIGENASVLYPTDEDYEYVTGENFRQIQEDGTSTLETRLKCKDGRIIDVLLSSTPLDMTALSTGITFTALNITDRKLAEKALQESEKRYRRILQTATDGFCLLDSDGRLLDVNDAYCKMTGYSKQELLSMRVSDLEASESPEEVLVHIENIIDQGEDRFEARGHRKDGSILDFEVSMRSHPDERGRLFAFSRDITERKQAEEEREKLQALLSNALEIANLAPWEYDVVEDLFTLNDHFYKLFRTTAEEVGGYTMSSEEHARRFIHPDDIHTLGSMNEVIEATDPDSGQRSEHRTIYGDGTVGYMSVKHFIAKDSQGKAVRFYGVNQDITEQKRMGEELLSTQKLESVGILAGGIAHDFNNILTTILGNTYMAKMEVDPEDEIFELLSEMETASSRAQALTKQLLTFAKGGAPVKETSSIKDVITESSIFVIRGSKSSCEFCIAEDLWSVEADIGQISHVISNVVINANQAMPDGGRIQVAGENLTIEDKHGLPIKPGRYVRICITDQGPGIEKKDIPKVFDPFYTTKPEGSGLGLATAYSIVKKHDGHIRVESKLGESTTFQVYLPASEETVQEKEEDKLIPGTGRILIMDDEAPLRKTAGKMLEKLGYEPEFAEEGVEAIEMYKTAKESGKPYKAVILDLTIPGGMGGRDTVKKLLEIEPGAKTIVSSGYSDDLLLADFKQYGFKGILPKPFDPRSLSRVLNEVIRGKTGP